jgi:DNA-binding transcriptional LysR family regulator
MANVPSYPGDMFEHLRAFATLAGMVQRRDRAAFMRAAQSVSVDVSVLRRRMHTLEGFVGSPLFQGHGASLSLTPRGAEVLAAGRKALSLVEEIHAGAPPRGRLRVACTGTFLSEILPSVLRRLRADFPELELQVARRGSHACLSLLRDGELDMAIVRSEQRPHGVSSVFAGKDRFFVATSKKGRLASVKKLTREAIAREPLIGYTLPSFTMERVNSVLAPLGAAPWIEVQGKAATLAYVAEGLGIGFVSALHGQMPAHRGVVLRDVTALFPPASFWVVWRKATLAPWETAFAAALRGVTSAT